MMKSQTVPDYLQSTYDLVTAAFPAGIEEKSSLPLLAFLSDELSFRNLADLIALITDGDAALLYNDVLTSLAVPISKDELAEVRRRLEPHGLDKWLAESPRASPNK